MLRDRLREAVTALQTLDDDRVDPFAIVARFGLLDDKKVELPNVGALLKTFNEETKDFTWSRAERKLAGESCIAFCEVFDLIYRLRKQRESVMDPDNDPPSLKSTQTEDLVLIDNMNGLMTSHIVRRLYRQIHTQPEGAVHFDQHKDAMRFIGTVIRLSLYAIATENKHYGLVEPVKEEYSSLPIWDRIEQYPDHFVGEILNDSRLIKERSRTK